MASLGSVLAALGDPPEALLAAVVFAAVLTVVYGGGRIVVRLAAAALGRARRRPARLTLVSGHNQRRRSRPRIRLPATPGLWGLVVILALAVSYGAMNRGGPHRPGETARRQMPARLVMGTVTHVRDGDTIEVDGLPVRFARLDCAERGTLAGRRATRRMRALAGGQSVRCRLTGARSYDRRIGSCQLSDGRDLAREMSAGGLCRMR